MKASLFKSFGTNKNAETTGIVVRYDDVRFLIARAGGANKKYKDVFTALAKPKRRQIDNGSLSEEEGEELMRRAYAKAIILSWGTLIRDETTGEPVLDKDGNETWTKTVTDDDGSVLEFTEDNVVHILKKLPDLFADLRTMAQTMQNFQESELEADKGN